MVGALVAHTAGGRLTLVDSDLQVHEIRGALGAPRYTAVSQDARLAYVSDSERQEMLVAAGVEVSGADGVVGRVRSGDSATTSGSTARERACGRLSGARQSASRSRSSDRRPGLVGSIERLAQDSSACGARHGRRVWVTSGDRGRIAIYEARSGRLVRTLGADAPPQHVTFMGDRAFVTSGDDAVLRVHALDGAALALRARARRLLQRSAGLALDFDPVARSRDALHVQPARRGAPRAARRSLVPRRVLHRRDMTRGPPARPRSSGAHGWPAGRRRAEPPWPPRRSGHAPR